MQDIGRGAARWIAMSTQIAQELIVRGGDIPRGAGQKPVSGYVVFVDEPEAHLHPYAVASIVRWCQRMVEYGFNVVVASHHEEFLRASGDDLTLVHVARDTTAGHTTARTLPSSRTTRLLELADDVGLHPASALSIRRAILFVEGPLDEAVLDEYGGLELDAAGVKIVPIHGTKNLEGLVAVELVTDLGIKTGILTDATDPTTMAERSGRNRSSEERNVMRVIQIAQAKGLPPPTPFGVPEDDLLFALPADAIRDYLKGPFPGWRELVAECRQTLGKGRPSDSVDWKSYANERYGLQIATPGGVRTLVRALDLENVPLPSVRTVIDEIVNWARSTD
jgi:predicted ATP-dependent endonuclease of OLD family